jgi:glyoxylase-like metal-dependent hydrolase (beta-lactamase superfamily II)
MDTPISRRSFVALASGGAIAAASLAQARADDVGGKDAKHAELPQGAGFYRFSVGSFRCVSLGDAEFELPTRPTWGQPGSLDEAEIAAALAYDFKKADAVRAYVQPLLIDTGSARILIDAGNGPRPDGTGKPESRLRATLAAAGYEPSDIDVVVLTHLHGDHTGGLTDTDGTELMPKARYVLHKDELAFWSGPNPDLSKTPSLPDGWKQNIIAGAKKAADLITPRAMQVAHGDLVVPGVRVLHEPGHTPGLIALEVSDGDTQLLVANDLIHHDTLSLRRPHMPVMFDADIELGAKTRARFLEKAASDKALIFSYHMPFPALGRVRAEAGAYAWVADGWRW